MMTVFIVIAIILVVVGIVLMITDPKYKGVQYLTPNMKLPRGTFVLFFGLLLMIIILGVYEDKFTEKTKEQTEIDFPKSLEIPERDSVYYVFGNDEIIYYKIPKVESIPSSDV